MAALPAHLVATPVLERLTGAVHGTVLGAGATAAWVDVDGFVVAVTTREVPLLPNAVAVTGGSGALAHPGLVGGAPVRVAPGRLVLGPLHVTWDPAGPPAWDPTVPVPAAAGPRELARRGAALGDALAAAPGAAPGAVDSHRRPASGWATLPARGPHHRRVGLEHALGPGRDPDLDPDPDPHPAVLVGELARIGLPTAVEPGGAAALGLLFRAVRERDPAAAGAAARELQGRGPGLTPEGDDLLAAVAGTLAVAGPVTGVDGPTLTGLLAALAPPPGRTTALSATLLDLAARRKLPEPAGRLLDFRPGAGADRPGAGARRPGADPAGPGTSTARPGADPAWSGALERLVRLGHGSGRAYAAGIAAALTLLAAGRAVR